MKKNVDEKLDIYKITTSKELLKYYQDWTKKNKYNQDMVDLNYVAPKETVSLFSSQIPLFVWRFWNFKKWLPSLFLLFVFGLCFDNFLICFSGVFSIYSMLFHILGWT